MQRLRLGDVRSGGLFPSLFAIAVVSVGVVLYLRSNRTFFYDEWDFFLCCRGWDPTVFFLPHNEHWSTIPILIWKLLFLVFGIRNYWPYEVVLLVAHVTSAFLLFLIVQRRLGDLPAYAAAATVLLLGTGVDNITWAFQIGFVESVALGLLAIWFIDTEWRLQISIPAISAALLVSLMCSSVGLAFVVAVGAMLFLDSQRRMLLPALIVPTAALWSGSSDSTQERLQDRPALRRSSGTGQAVGPTSWASPNS